jgi:hypothetical protein
MALMVEMNDRSRGRGIGPYLRLQVPCKISDLKFRIQNPKSKIKNA